MDRIESPELDCYPSLDCPQWPRCYKVGVITELSEIIVCKAVYIEMLQSVNVPVDPNLT